MIEGIGQGRQKSFAFRGDFQASREALEKGNPQSLLQAFHLLAYSGLGNAKLDRGAGEAEMSRRSLEGPQTIQREELPNHLSPRFSFISSEISSFAAAKQCH
ncbi:hypothetical protein CUJ84_Chr003006 [Rhizobium leguminosarum]|uniref:Uncharacterized protein n=1 Tax=Rhizobium leguminosarum TaxID=384 RepID=A0A2K9Z5H2_RHILE|nr:hypothetical protein CUJ84_Chr003006 [Rhizobium leguminosarum]